MDILSKYRKILINGLKKDYPDNNFENISFEFPRDRSHGDFSTNAAMVLSKKYNLDLEIIFNNVTKIFSKSHDFTNIEIAKSGFINFSVKDNILYELLSSIIKVLIDSRDFSTACDTLSNLLSFVGYDVCREYYINDSGEQITKLAKSVYVRYLQSLGETKEEIQEGFYPGEYLIELGERLKNKFGSKFKDSSEDVWFELFKKESIDYVMGLIREDLNSLNIKHNVFTSEKNLLNDNKVDKTFNLLKEKNLLYEGITAPPKGSNKDEWSKVKHTLFKSKEFGDDEDRVVKKHNGEWTYFMPDIAYHLDKYERGYEKIINIFGADHSGYINRMKAAVKAISDSKADFEIKTCQLVRLSRSGKPIKMSKRSGSFITLSEIIDEVGSDAVRFMMVSRKNDAQLDFDFEVFKSENNDNPIFYIQYAHARISSLINNASEKLDIKEIDESTSDLNLLKNINERNIIMLLANYPKIVEQAALFMEPHRISFYLRDLSSAFHQYWNLKIDNKRLIILDKDNIDLSLSRITLLKCVAITIRSGLAILGIKALKEL